MSPVYCGERGRESALSYATQRAGYGRAEIQVLDEAWNVVETIGNEEARCKELSVQNLPTIAPDTLALRRMFRFHFRDGHFPSAE